MNLAQQIQSGLSHHRAGRLAEAEKTYREVLSENPDQVDALNLLGTLVLQTGNADQAVEMLGRAVRLNPNLAGVHANLGSALAALGRREEALAAFRTAIRLKPDTAGLHKNLAVTLKSLGQHTEAVHVLGEVLRLKPDDASAHAMLGDSLNILGRHDEAITAYRKAVEIKPDFVEAHCNLGIALVDAGKSDEAAAAYQQAIRIRPTYAEAYYNLADLLKDGGRFDEAIALFRRAIRLKPDFAEAHANLGSTLKDLGLIEEAFAFLRGAVQLKPAEDIFHSSFVFALNHHPDWPPQNVFAEHLAWADRHAAGLIDPTISFGNERSTERKLRIGYVSGDFRRHAVAQFFSPLLENHDRSMFEIFCYSNVKKPDEVSQRLRQKCDAWRDIFGQSDEAVAKQIRSDRIDILVDLSGHTQGNRLRVFARKPAPVQATYLGYANTTGMAAIDYRLTDDSADPPGMTDSLNAEKLWRLPVCAWCYQPRSESPEIKPRIEGPITFGCFNAMSKINPRLIAIWADLLKKAPASRLLLKSAGAGVASARQRLIAEFARHGIAADRIEMIGRIDDPQKHLGLYHRVDIALDTYPYHGTTTTCEALWMGVPVVTLAGKTHVSRVGVSLLNSIGHPELIAQSPDEYVAVAMKLAADPSLLSELRNGLRDQMRSSPLTDGKRFAANVEAVLRQMWRNWCDCGSDYPSGDPQSLRRQIDAGLSHHRMAQLAEAEKIYRQVLAQKPDDVDALHLLGALAKQTGRIEEAIELLRRTVQLKPDYAEAQNNLGVALVDTGQLDEGITCYRRAIQHKPDYAEAYNNLGIALAKMNPIDPAIAAYRDAIRLDPGLAEAHNNLGNALGDLGRVDDAIAAYRQALAVRPDYADALDSLLFMLQFRPDYTPAAIYREHQHWDESYGQPLKKFIQPHTNNRDPDRRLRIGYVSMDFRDHPVGRFMLPLLERHDHYAFEIVCYSDAANRDEMTKRIRSCADRWNEIIGLPDLQVADQIRRDGIDILVDLAGHTAGSRLRVFARKPAPIQVNYLGYPGSTGLSAIDYRLTDALADPPGTTESLHSEKLWRLPVCNWCFSEPTDAPDVGPLPANSSNSISFGSFNNFAKASSVAMDLWARILNAVPNSRLILKARRLGEPSIRDRIHEFFKSRGVQPDRLDLRTLQPAIRDHLDAYNQMDIALDTYPYHGTTTTCDALWMGVPVVTLAGVAHVSRVGVSLLTNVGLPELIARSPEEYISTAVALANDLPRLTDIRHNVRSRMRASPLMDAARFARDIESVYRQMWRNWCESTARSAR
jgi:predicted O-linked N-acetylglucosamine transferase (SPINDLY family)